MVFPEYNFKFLSEYSDTVPILRCSGLTKKALVPGWRIGWLAMFGKPGVFDNIKKALKGITNILLMPTTIC
jgi:tyrosine aminotransferase